MFTAAGLRTHIWNNNLKSALLLAGFPVLLLGLVFAIALMMIASGAQDAVSVPQAMDEAWGWTVRSIPFVLVGAGLWFVIAWFSHQAIIDASTGARRVSRTQEPELYNLLENLAIARGLPMPGLRIIETEARNAYASGLTQSQATVTVTRGLMQALSREELEAVLAHELTHILNRDVRLLVISVIFVGIISFTVELMARGIFRGAVLRSGGSRRGSSGNAAAIMLFAMVIIGVAYALALVIRFAMSRSREYMADAGAVALTKNPDAMISALERISGRSEIEAAPKEVRQMFIHTEAASSFAGLFATHPPIDKRIRALERYAGGRRAASATSVPRV